MSVAEYDALVAQLRAANVGQDAAERFAREKFPDAAAEQRAEDERIENVLEKTEQWEVEKIFRAFGFEVYRTSQSRRSKISVGLPDLWCMHRDQPIAFWWETKRAIGGRFSDAQLRFREQAMRCGAGYGSGDRRAARHHIITLGLARIVGDTLEPIRREA